MIYGLKLILWETEVTAHVDLLRLLFQRLQQHFGSALWLLSSTLRTFPPVGDKSTLKFLHVFFEICIDTYVLKYALTHICFGLLCIRELKWLSVKLHFALITLPLSWSTNAHGIYLDSSHLFSFSRLQCWDIHRKHGMAECWRQQSLQSQQSHYPQGTCSMRDPGFKN